MLPPADQRAVDNRLTDAAGTAVADDFPPTGESSRHDEPAGVISA
jgi:hypothetical protein